MVELTIFYAKIKEQRKAGDKKTGHKDDSLLILLLFYFPMYSGKRKLSPKVERTKQSNKELQRLAIMLSADVKG